MLPSFENLKKILLQEQKLGYENKAVIGGLELFANNWLPKALEEATTKEERLQIEKVTAALKKYPENTTQEEREVVIKNILDELKIQETVPSPPEEPPPPPPKKQPASKPLETGRKSPPSPTPRRQTEGGTLEGLDASVTRLPGIKQGNANKLEKLGVTTIGDLLTLYPRRYDDYRSLKTINQLVYGEDVTIIAQIWQTHKRQSKGNMTLITSILSDGTGTIEVTWFNQPWLEKRLAPGKQIVISGRVQQYLGRLVFQSPDWEFLDKSLVHTGRLVPVYPLTSGITARWMRNLQKKTVDYWTQRLPDHLPDEVKKRLNLRPLDEATRQIHFPDSWKTLEAARRRLAFDELLLIQLGVLKQRQVWKSQPGAPVKIDRALVDTFISALPYTLTQAQQRMLDEILGDMAQPSPMSRLLQGDVGSGKTVVALAAMIAAIADDGQAAILAPTEILAEQHYQSMRSLLETTGFANKTNIQLLTGSTKTRERQQILGGLANGTIQLLVGTHAVIQKDVSMHNLRLAIVDEQHRFGVEQRGLLRQKGENPHMLVMSATPIPRTLALTIYGDLDLSIIDEMPPGRQVIQTRWLSPLERERAYAFLHSQIEKGRQAFIICPLVEESDKIEARSAVEEHERLQKEIFPDLKLGLLHGRMNSQEKDAVMTDFRDGKTHILVSTSVVEVGIDIPNASTILIEGANRFGLAQLHQFRGRVGRGEHQSYCLLLADSTTTEAQARLEVMERTNNGFELAEEDLKLRGPGEFFGTKQSGLPNLKLVKLSDTQLLEIARKEAKAISDSDPTLSKPEHKLLTKRLNAFWTKITDPS
jgi:ATP-dependent DNA helicase RecG